MSRFRAGRQYYLNPMASVVFNDRSVQDTVDEQQCCICMQTNDTDTHTLPCDHTFHTECIIRWFRSSNAGTCPLCRDEEPEYLSFYTLRHRLRFLRNYSRRKVAPKSLKRAIEGLKKSEKKKRDAAKEMNEFRKNNREILNQMSKLRRKRWSAEGQVRRKWRKIAMTSYRGVVTPLIFRQRALV